MHCMVSNSLSPNRVGLSPLLFLSPHAIKLGCFCLSTLLSLHPSPSSTFYPPGMIGTPQPSLSSLYFPETLENPTRLSSSMFPFFPHPNSLFPLLSLCQPLRSRVVALELTAAHQSSRDGRVPPPSAAVVIDNNQEDTGVRPDRGLKTSSPPVGSNIGRDWSRPTLVRLRSEKEGDAKGQSHPSLNTSAAGRRSRQRWIQQRICVLGDGSESAGQQISSVRIEHQDPQDQQMKC